MEAVILHGGPAVDSWLSGLGLRRWEYEDLVDDVAEEYRSYTDHQNPLMSDAPPFARVGGWHVAWSDDDFYLPREMRLMLWTFEDSEPWYEVFLTGRLNLVVKERIT